MSEAVLLCDVATEACLVRWANRQFTALTGKPTHWLPAHRPSLQGTQFLGCVPVNSAAHQR